MAAPVIEGTYTATSSGAITWDITGVVIPAGLTDGLLVVGNSYEYGNGGAESLVNSVVIDPGGANEAAFTRAVNASVFASYGNEASIWYLKGASIPPAGTYTVRISTDLPSGSAYTVYAASGCYVLSGADQTTVPDATANQTATVNAGLTTNITTVAADTLVLDSYSQGDNNAPTANAGQTVRWDLASGTSRGTSSTKGLTSAGTASLGYTHASSNRVAHSLASFAATATGGGTVTLTKATLKSVSANPAKANEQALMAKSQIQPISPQPASINEQIQITMVSMQSLSAYPILVSEAIIIALVSLAAISAKPLQVIQNVLVSLSVSSWKRVFGRPVTIPGAPQSIWRMFRPITNAHGEQIMRPCDRKK